ncbi:hypothetical protein [Humibacillus xanthopallidus]|nr:hypothetical protein [Humibacillus xanthopallidus]
MHGTVLVGPEADAVIFRAVLEGGAPSESLFVRWYSSLPATPGEPPKPSDPPTAQDVDKFALQTQLDWVEPTSLEFVHPLLVGSQSITVAVKDQMGDDETALKAVQAAGTAGGGPMSPAPCVVHVLLASSRVPVPPATQGAVVLAKRSEGLWAEAPPTWKDDDVNRFRYSWTFEKSGTAIVLDPNPTALEFQDRKDAQPPRVGFTEIPATPAVPAVPPSVPAVPDGVYTLTLRVVYAPDLAAAELDPSVRVRKHEHVLHNVEVKT